VAGNFAGGRRFDQFMSLPSTRPRKPSGFFTSTGTGSRPSFSAANISSTSPSTGNRPVLDFEKTSLPSTMTSNWPVLPAVISVFSPNLESSEAARLAARGL
jgi:hypothetical protein